MARSLPLSTIHYLLSTTVPLPGSTRALSGGGLDRVSSRIAASQQNPLGFVRVFPAQFRERGTKRFHPEILGAFAPFDAVQESGEIDEFTASIQKIEIENLLACHTLYCRPHYNRLVLLDNNQCDE
jgi:hypothetical protein